MHINGNRGYIGSYLSDILNISSGSDLCWFDPGVKQDFIQGHPGADIVIHLAGHSSEPMCSSDPHGAWINNVDKFRLLVEHLRADQLLVYASSASVYAPALSPVTELSTTFASRPYDCTKIVCDAIAQTHISMGKNIVGLRLGTVAGLSRIQRVDTIVNAMVKSSLERELVSCVDPAVRRTLLFLPDLAEAIKLIIASPAPGIYNLGSLDSNVGEIATTISALFDSRLDISYKGTNFYDFHLDSSRFISTFGDFRVTSLVETIFDLYDGLPAVKQGRRDVAPNF